MKNVSEESKEYVDENESIALDTSKVTKPVGVWQNRIREWLRTFLCVLGFLIVLYFIFWPFIVRGESMEPNYVDGDRIFVSRIHPYLFGLGRGDIVVCDMGSSGLLIVKRIIGLPGDEVELRGGSVYINGLRVEENYTDMLTFPDMSVSVGSDEYFVMGDNRGYSLDSRAYGPLNKNSIVGKVSLMIPTGGR